jgi:hypothetical protein
LSRAIPPRLVAQFENCTLPKEEWTHQAHLTVGLWYASRLPYQEALVAVREGILRLNAAHGVPTTPTRGYHETITRFYVRVLCDYVASEGERPMGSWPERVSRLLSRYGDRELPLPALHEGPADVVRGEIRLGGAGSPAPGPGGGQPLISCRRSLVIRRRTEPSWMRSPIRTTVPPRISVSTWNAAMTSLPSSRLRAS